MNKIISGLSLIVGLIFTSCSCESWGDGDVYAAFEEGSPAIEGAKVDIYIGEEKLYHTTIHTDDEGKYRFRYESDDCESIYFVITKQGFDTATTGWDDGGGWYGTIRSGLNRLE
jgi:hypothetical protein